MESDLSATGDFKVSNYGFNSVNTHQHTVNTLFYSGFVSIACHSCLLPLCLSLSNLLAVLPPASTWGGSTFFFNFFYQ